MAEIFKVDLKGDPTGTSSQGGVEASYKDIHKILGDPMDESDGYKVSTEWILTGPRGCVVTLYDYKATSLYDDGMPSVEEFRAQRFYDWHIGADNKESGALFEGWLSAKLAEIPAPEPEFHEFRHATKAEAEAHQAGVQWANDSAIGIMPIVERDGKWFAVYQDQDN